MVNADTDVTVSFTVLVNPLLESPTAVFNELTSLTNPDDALPTVVCNVVILDSVDVTRLVRFVTFVLVAVNADVSALVPIAVELSLTDLTNPDDALPTVVVNVDIELALLDVVLCNVVIALSADVTRLVRLVTFVFVVVRELASALEEIAVVWSAIDLTNPLFASPTVVFNVLTSFTKPDDALPTVVVNVVMELCAAVMLVSAVATRLVKFVTFVFVVLNALCSALVAIDVV